MSSHSSYLIVRLQQICTDVEYHTRASSPPVLLARNSDPTDFNAIGAHLPSPVRKIFHPYDMDVSEDEAPKRVQEASSTPRVRPSHRISPDQEDRNISSAPPTLSPAQLGPYLHQSEIPQLHHSRSRKKYSLNSSYDSNPSSHTTTIHKDPPYYPTLHTATQQPSQYPASPYTTVNAHHHHPVSQHPISYTPSHHSEGSREDYSETQDDVEQDKDKGPRPPHPYSEYYLYNPQYGQDVINKA